MKGLLQLSRRRHEGVKQNENGQGWEREWIQVNVEAQRMVLWDEVRKCSSDHIGGVWLTGG